VSRKRKKPLPNLHLVTIPCSTGDEVLELVRDPDVYGEPGVRVYQPGSPAPDAAWIPVEKFLEAADRIREEKSS